MVGIVGNSSHLANLAINRGGRQIRLQFSVTEDSQFPPADGHYRPGPYGVAREGTRCQTVQTNTDQDRVLKVGVVTDVTGPFRERRTTYQPLRDAVAIDFGLSTLVATDDGDLMGRDFLDQLAKLDRQIDNLARHRQRADLKTRSERYDKLVRKLRGYVTTEINRVLERLVRLKRPETR